MVCPKASLEPDITQLLRTHGRLTSLPGGTRLFEPGMDCSHFIVIEDGAVQVRMVSVSGREIVLYRIGPGETCIMTTACLMAQEPYLAEGITETTCTAWMLSKKSFDDLIACSPVFRLFVFREYGRRLRTMMTTLDDALFQRIDIRLATLLCRTGEDRLVMTHQSIAEELGTAREVVSRHMKELETRGWIVQRRGSIEITDRNALRKLSAVM